MRNELTSPVANALYDGGNDSAQQQTATLYDQYPKNFSREQRTKKRGYMYNPETGELQKVIQKRQRKSQDQLNVLNEEFMRSPAWSKETLFMIAKKTGLSEAQVYKWGWDQKRKKFGIEEAEKMRQYETKLDQENAAKAKYNAINFNEHLKKINLITANTSNPANRVSKQTSGGSSEEQE